MPSPDGSVLVAQGLACRRGGRLVFEHLELSLAAGEALVLRGPNGSGKSTLLRLLSGLLPPAAGTVSWDGEDVARDPATHRARLHYLAHADALKTALSPRENLAFAADLAGGAADVGSALAAFDLGPLADLPVRFLSAGQRRRTALARLLATVRPLWLLDEPGVGLDQASRGRLEAAIAAHRRQGGIAVVATHGDVAVDDPLVLDFAAA
ncbi:MAG: heme ABC exporter ATP-binding protein CcmA [Geminicoccaceae bacterium]